MIDYSSITFEPINPQVDKYKSEPWHLTGMRIGARTEIGWKYFETIRRALFLRYHRYAGINAPWFNGDVVALAGWSTYVNGHADVVFESPGAPPGKFRVFLDVAEVHEHFGQLFVNNKYYASKAALIADPPPGTNWNRVASPHRYSDFDQISGRPQINLFEKGSKSPPNSDYQHFYVDRPAWRWLPKQLHPLRQLKKTTEEFNHRFVEPNRRYIAQNYAAGTRYTLSSKKVGSSFVLVNDDVIEMELGTFGNLSGGRYTNPYSEPGMGASPTNSDALPLQSSGIDYGVDATQWGFDPKICLAYQEMIAHCAELLPWYWPIMSDTPQGIEYIRNENGRRLGWMTDWVSGGGTGPTGGYVSGSQVRHPDEHGVVCGWTASVDWGEEENHQEPSSSAWLWSKSVVPFGYGTEATDESAAPMGDERWGCNGSVLELALWITSNEDGIYDWAYDTHKPFAPYEILCRRNTAFHTTNSELNPSSESLSNTYPLAHGNWHRCWPGMGWPKNNGSIVLPGIRYVGAWKLDKIYPIGVRRYGEEVVDGDDSTTVFVCILGHASDTDSEPGVGVDWETYWEPVFNFQRIVTPPGSLEYWDFQNFTKSTSTADGKTIEQRRMFWPGIYNNVEPVLDYEVLDINDEDLQRMNQRHDVTLKIDESDLYEVGWEHIKSLWDVLVHLSFIADFDSSYVVERRAVSASSELHGFGATPQIANAAALALARTALDLVAWTEGAGWDGLTHWNIGSHSLITWQSTQFRAEPHIAEARIKITGGRTQGKYFADDILIPLVATLGGHFTASTDPGHFETCEVGFPDGTLTKFTTLRFTDDPPPPVKVYRRLLYVNVGKAEDYNSGDVHTLPIDVLSGHATAPAWSSFEGGRFVSSWGNIRLPLNQQFIIYRLNFEDVDMAVFTEESYV